ncbi:MAG TPA: 50S ribosomal protein L11 methyltransferase [Thermoanaerobaculia bacterium]|nr:50S ribosomal protein L11 methyltransferase [Thermoanaerobaculia bacterium]
MTEYVLEIRFSSSPALEELVEARLFLTSFLGSVSSESSGTTVTAFFDSAEAREAAVALFSNLPVELRQADRDPIDWLEHYQQSLHAMEIGERFVVAPDASLLPAGGRRIGIVVPQEQAFGTGSHESTALCMTLLETLDLQGRRGLDIGSGSGILAIAALRLGAARVIAFDVDPDTCAALRDNRVRNGIPPERMPLFIGSMEALRGGTFDFVLMNILPDVIVELLPDVVPRMADEARMVVSGILLAVHGEVVDAARRHGLAVVGERSRGEWWAGALQRVR